MGPKKVVDAVDSGGIVVFFSFRVFGVAETGVFGLVEFGVVVKERCPGVGLGSVSGFGVGHQGWRRHCRAEIRFGFSLLTWKLKSPAAMATDLVEGVVVGELSVFVEGGNDSLLVSVVNSCTS